MRINKIDRNDVRGLAELVRMTSRDENCVQMRFP